MIKWNINGEQPSDEFEIVNVTSPDSSGLCNTSSELRFIATKAWHWMTFECTASMEVTSDTYQVKRSVVLEVLGKFTERLLLSHYIHFN